MLSNTSTPIFSIVPVEVALDPRLTKMQLRVLIALLSFRSKNSDTVWPSRDVLSTRCGYNITTISRITSQLVKLGWLHKDGKGGYSKATRYRITVPELVTVDGKTTVAEPGTVSSPDEKGDSESKTVSEPATVAEPETVSEPDKQQCTDRTTNSVQTVHGQRTNQELKRTDHIICYGFNFSLWPAIPSEQIWKDWKTHRHKKKASITQSVIDLMAGEIQKAFAAGYPVDYCLAYQMEAGWQGFKFDWVMNREGKPQIDEEKLRGRLTDRTWAEGVQA